MKKPISTQQKLQVKIFVALTVTPALRNALHHSSTWKLAQMTFTPKIEEIIHDKQRYLGFYCSKEKVGVRELQYLWTQLKETIQPHCKEIDLEKISLVIFPKQLIG